MASPRATRGLLLYAVGLFSVLFVLAIEQIYRGFRPDIALWWVGARALVTGHNPYDLVGPGLTYDWPFRELYPATSFLIALPIAWLPLSWVWTAFVGAGAVLLAWTLSRNQPGALSPKLLVFLSYAFLSACIHGQWSLLLTSAAVTPSLGFLLAAKPNLGAALFLAYPSRRAAAGIAAIGLLSVVVAPWWPLAWLRVLSDTGHMVPMVARPWGFLLLLAALRWRRQDARLLLALSVVPMTPVAYESVPLFLIVERWWEGGLLVALTWATAALGASTANTGDIVWFDANARHFLWLLYLPCMVIILRRGNVAEADHGSHARGDARSQQTGSASAISKCHRFAAPTGTPSLVFNAAMGDAAITLPLSSNCAAMGTSSRKLSAGHRSSWDVAPRMALSRNTAPGAWTFSATLARPSDENSP